MAGSAFQVPVTPEMIATGQANNRNSTAAPIIPGKQTNVPQQNSPQGPSAASSQVAPPTPATNQSLPVAKTAAVTPAAVNIPNIPSNPAAPTTGQASQATKTLSENQSELQSSELSSEDYAVKRSQGLLDEIAQSYADELGTVESNAQGAAVASGQGGTPAAASAEYQAMKPVLDKQQAAIASEILSIQNSAASTFAATEGEAQTNAEQTQAAYKSAQKDIQSSAANMASVGYTTDQLKEESPDEYEYMLQYGFNGDENSMKSAFLFNNKNTLLNSGQPVYSNGTTQVYGQMTINSDGSPSIKYTTVNTPYTIPAGWTQQKIGTNGIIVYDPNKFNPSDPSTYSTFSVDPLSGAVTGSSGGAADPTSTPSSNTPGGPTSPAAQNYISTATSTAGIADPSTPFQVAVNGDGTAANPGVGIGALLAGVLKAEGGSPSGVKNNPGNVKYVPGMAGATDSGVKATDGGTFASFRTPESGNQASAKTLNSIAANLGPNATVQDVLNKYANLGSSNTTGGTTGPNGLSTTQYGALANVSDFNPNAAGDKGIIDKDAYSYLKLYLSGTQPTNTNLTGKRGGTSSEFQQAQTRAQDLYFKATGKQLPNMTELESNLGFITGNNQLLNTLNVQEPTIKANSDLLQAKITAGNINQNAPVINRVIDPIIGALGNTSEKVYQAQVSTLGNELGSLLALKNATGTTVHDKLVSADLLDKNSSAEQEAEVVNTIMQEAQNARTAITMASAKLYLQTDPLGLDPQNPLSDPTSFAQTVGLDLPAIQKDYPDMTPEEILSQYIGQQ